MLSASALTVGVLALAGSVLAVTVKPSISSFKPASGKAGTTVTITGKSLTGATAVKIGGLKAIYKIGSATKITATVPGKAKTGKISVTTKGGTATSAKSFTVSVPSVAAPAPVAPAPVVATYAPNGSGTLTVSPGGVAAGSTGNTLTFTYTAATGGMFNGSVVITVPAGWPPPVTTANPGCVSSSGGVSALIAISGQSIYFSNLTLAAGASATVTYGAKSGTSFTGAICGPNNGVTAPATPGAYTFTSQQKSSNDLTAAAGVLTALGASPTVTVS